MAHGLTNVDVALLKAEWHKNGACPVCWHVRPAGPRSFQHAAGCEIDLALSERGYPTQAERDAARDMIHESR